MDLGATIKSVRSQKGMKQNQLAEKCRITAAYLSQIENNIKDPNISTLKIIADNLEIPLPILFFLSLDMEDIPPAKRKSFEILGPSVRSMINEFFTNASAKND